MLIAHEVVVDPPKTRGGTLARLKSMQEYKERAEEIAGAMKKKTGA